MIFDYYASLARQKTCPNSVGESGLVSGFADGCLVWSCPDKSRDKKVPDPKNEARRCHMKRASEFKDLKLPEDLNFEPDFSQLPNSSWFRIEVGFKLLSPWYSKDDRPFHVLDNPVRKDRVFGVPFMSAASWKGLLRWACRMQEGLYGHLESHGMKMDDWKDQEWIVHLFGNERAEGDEFSRGALVFYPTWFNEVNFEVINPHKRGTRAGTQPIYYEVVPAGTKGRLHLLYAPLPGKIENDKVNPVDVIANLIDAITALLETYGISAKRTAGWGAAEIESCNLYLVKDGWLEKNISIESEEEFIQPKEAFKKLMDANGRPISVLLNKQGAIISKTQFIKLKNEKPGCTKAEHEEFKKWYEKHSEDYQKILGTESTDNQALVVRKLEFDTLAELKKVVKKLKDAQNGGGR